MVRAFVAVEINEETRKRLTSIQSALKRADADVRWVPPEQIHLTLAFLGDINSDTLALIAEVLDAAVRETRSFNCSVGGLGAFGSRRSPRVLWIGVEPSRELARLREEVHAGLRGVGLDLDAKPFHPHLTLGRVKSARGRDALLKALESMKAERCGTTRIREVRLMRSILGPRGASHSVLHGAPLRDRNGP